MPSAEQQRALEEALDRLLDPLADELPKPDDANGDLRSTTYENRPQPSRERRDLLPIVYDDRRTIGDLARKLRWSQRGVFPVLRRTAAWAIGIAAFFAVVWVIATVGPVR